MVELSAEQVSSLIQGNKITVEGFSLSVAVDKDEDSNAPWQENDGHGVVNGWTQREPKEGEVLLGEFGKGKLYYDTLASLEIAKRDGWGLPPEEAEGLTPDEIAAKTVERDLSRLKAWVNREWYFCYITVSLSFDGIVLGSRYIGGYESDYLDNCTDVVNDLVNDTLPEAKRKVSEKIKSWIDLVLKFSN